MVTLLYQTLQSRLKYDSVIRRGWVISTGRNCALKFSVKPLQTETCLDLLLTATGTRHPSVQLCLTVGQKYRTCYNDFILFLLRIIKFFYTELIGSKDWLMRVLNLMSALKLFRNFVFYGFFVCILDDFARCAVFPCIYLFLSVCLSLCLSVCFSLDE